MKILLVTCCLMFADVCANAQDGKKDTTQQKEKIVVIATGDGKSAYKKAQDKREVRVVGYGRLGSRVNDSIRQKKQIIVIGGEKEIINEIDLSKDPYVIISKEDKDGNALKELINIRKELEIRDTSKVNRSRSFLSLIPPPPPPIPDGDRESSQLSLTKTFKGESVETIKKFSVSSSAVMLSLSLNGQVKSGSINITLVKPNGNKFKTFEIDPTSNVAFNQRIDLKKDPKEWTGDWQIQIEVEKADGSYGFQINTR